MQTAANQKNLWSLVLILLLAGGGYWFAKQWGHAVGDERYVRLQSHCDLSTSDCRSELPSGGVVTLSVVPRPIVPMQPLEVRVLAERTEISPQHLDIVGVNMEMGLNRTEFQPQGPGSWQGQTLLPICTARRMEWRASLLVSDAGDRYLLEYLFATSRR